MSISTLPRRVVRFYPQDLSGNGYDDTKPPCLAFLAHDKYPNIGTEVRVVTGDIFKPDELVESNKRVRIGKLLTPLDVNTIWCVGLNYRKHAKESGVTKLPKYPVLFMKPVSCLTNPNDPILLPMCCTKDEIDYEVELIIVIGKKCKNVSRENALDYVLGYTVGNDVSARNWQLNPELSGSQWIRGKTFDTFSPIGPTLLLQENNLNPNNLNVWTYVNGNKLQNSNTKDFIFNVQEIIEFLSKDCTLLPGTIIFTGTPEGVGFARKPKIYLKENDIVKVGVQYIGQLCNSVKKATKISKL